MSDADLGIDDMLAELGFRDADARRLARQALVDAKLTNATKVKIAARKLDDVKAVLGAQFVVACRRAECQRTAPGGRTIITTSTTKDCSICGGSANQSGIARAVAEMAAHGLKKLVVVGGAPSTQDELRDLVGAQIALRIIPGTDRRTGRDADADLAWADLVIVWGGTELDHKVSKLYTDKRDPKVITCSKRGIAALAETLQQAASRR